MKIKSGLVFSRATGKLVGFTELGDMNEELSSFERSLSDKPKEKDLATHVMTFMARGLHKRFHYPIGYFASAGFDSDQLFPCVWEAVRIMHAMNLKVRAFVCDGASPNRRFFKLHKMADGCNESVDNVVYWAWNRQDKTQKIYFFSDTPHLMKTLRNNFEKSHGHTNTRQLMVRTIQ